MLHLEPGLGCSAMVQRIVARSFPHSETELRFGSRAISELVSRYGSPVFVYDAGIIDRQWDRLRSSLPARVDIFYSMKANPNRCVVQHLLKLGCGIEVASGGELRQALAAGCSPSRLIFAGPGKSNAELRFALRQGISEIHAESLLELRRLAEACRELECTAPVSLRVNPISSVQGGAMRMGGKASAFGIDEEQLDDAMNLIGQLPALKWKGLHFYAGTQILDTDILLRQYRHAIEVAAALGERWGQPIATLDFGGGLGVPYFESDAELDLPGIAMDLAKLIEDAQSLRALAETSFIVEPGRFLVGECGVYVTRVLDVKKSRGKAFVVVDGGMHHHLAASGNLGQTIKRNFPIAVLNRLNEPATEPVEVVGCLCTPLDTIGRSVMLPPVEPGDLVGIFQSGAYALSASPQGFLSHEPPVEVFLNGSDEEALHSTVL